MRHVATLDGGLGFCGAVVAPLASAEYHGPLVMALDSNILIDLEQYGAAMVDGDLSEVSRHQSAAYRRELEALSEVLCVWALRDIRFTVTARILTDARKSLTEARRGRRISTVEALVRSLAFQSGDWAQSGDLVRQPSAREKLDLGLPANADADLVAEAASIDAHVFLTRDKQVLSHGSQQASSSELLIASPARVATIFAENRVDAFAGGTCGELFCPYSGWTQPAPDLGKWGSLFAALGSSADD